MRAPAGDCPSRWSSLTFGAMGFSTALAMAIVCGWRGGSRPGGKWKGNRITLRAGRHVWAGAMAGSLMLVPFFVCVLGLACCGSVADSRAVLFREKYEASVADEYGLDEGPQTFTMQDHFNFLKERELARRGRVDTRTSTLGATSNRFDAQEVEDVDPIFVEDYDRPESNKLQYNPLGT